MRKVAIFPGHVGKDSGAIEATDSFPWGEDKLHTVEAAVTLPLAHKVASLLDLMGMDNRICFGDFVSRVAMSSDCSVGLSIHADVSTSDLTHGFHVIHFPGSKCGKALANSVDGSMGTCFSRARSVHSRRDLAILRETAFPCALVEVGFLSNVIEESELLNVHYQHRIAFALVDGLRRYDCLPR